jgi:hypothetical protein
MDSILEAGSPVPPGTGSKKGEKPSEPCDSIPLECARFLWPRYLVEARLRRATFGGPPRGAVLPYAAPANRTKIVKSIWFKSTRKHFYRLNPPS